MCRLHTEGTQHGCGHYIITKKLAKEDCRNKYCIHSERHPPNCPSCPDCDRYYGPDASETITRKTPEYCTECAYWFKGPGRRDRRQ